MRSRAHVGPRKIKIGIRVSEVRGVVEGEEGVEVEGSPPVAEAADGIATTPYLFEDLYLTQRALDQHRLYPK